jgi:hypothetical protein
MTQTRNRAALAIPTAIVVSLALAACGGSSSTTAKKTTSVPIGVPNAAQINKGASNFRACLEAHGVKLPAGGAGVLGGLIGPGAKLPPGVTRQQAQSALRTCGAGALPRGRFTPGASGKLNLTSPGAKLAFERFATCLHEKGVNVGAPNLSGKGAIFGTKGLNLKDPKFRAAARECAATLRTALGK